MAKNQLKVVGIQIHRPAPGPSAAAGVQAWIELIVELENTGAPTLYVWASHRGYEYDAGSQTLTLHMAERPLVLPPNIIMISQHPRAPEQIELAGKSRVKVRLRIPSFIRRPSPDGKGWIEDPIGPVGHIDVRVQHAQQPFDQPGEHETEHDYRARMQTHGDVVQVRITPASDSEPPK